MSKFTEGLALLQEDFKERFGVDVAVEMFVFHHNNLHVKRDVAEQITAKLQEEINGTTEHNHSFDGQYAWAKVERWANGGAVAVSVFYPAEEVVTV